MSTTHEVRNQAPPRSGIDEYGSHPALVEAVERYGAAGATDRLRAIGSLVGEAGFQHDAELANTHPPVLSTHDRWGHRIDEVQFHPAYPASSATRSGAARTPRAGRVAAPPRTWRGRRRSCCSRRSSQATRAR